MIYGKIIDGIISAADITAEDEELYRGEGFLPLHNLPMDRELTETEDVSYTYTEQDGELVGSPNVVVSKEKILAKIARLKEEIANGDYKIIKCYESSMVGETLPYDVTALHQEREALRQEVNNLESRLEWI